MKRSGREGTVKKGKDEWEAKKKREAKVKRRESKRKTGRLKIR